MLSDLDTRFDDPPRSFSPVPIWWWSGEKLDAQRLRWQLERFAEGGVYNLLILDRKSTRLNSSHVAISYAVFCLKKKKLRNNAHHQENRRSYRKSVQRSQERLH